MPRTLTDIIPPSRRRQFEETPQVSSESFSQTPPPQEPRSQYKPRRRFPYGTAIFALIVVALVAAGLYAFSGAKIEVTATQNAGAVSGTFTATQASGDLPFEVITADKEAMKSVPAESTATVHQAAQGTITIYNSQAKPQALVANTRFESPDGLVFRIHSNVSVPAGTAANPGSVTATAFADTTGVRYNIPATTFTLPGLSGSPQFTQVTAKSAAPMTGGFEGSRPTASQATEDAAHSALQATLTTDMQAAIAAQVPQGYVLIPGSTFTSYIPEPSDADATGAVQVHEKGTVTAVVFPSDAFARAIAHQLTSSYTDQTLTLKDTSKLTLTPAVATAPTASAATFQFSLSGTGSIVWKVDPTKVSGAVAGKTREAATSLLKGFPEIDQAYLTLRPFWRSTFPADPSKITVVVK
jgi:hypothetical protein